MTGGRGDADVILPAIRGLLPELTAPLRDFLLPPLCFHCGGARPRELTGLCFACWKSVEVIRKEDPGVRDAVARICADGGVDAFFSLFRFRKNAPIQSLLHELKYGGKPMLGYALGVMLGTEISRLGGFPAQAGIVPVPLHSAKRRERAYNQSEQIARGLADRTKTPLIPDLLRRNRYTRSQTEVRANERASNVEGAFSVPSPWRRLQGEGICLVDDVVTSGSTLRECARVLREVGFKDIAGVSLALAVQADHS